MFRQEEGNDCASVEEERNKEITFNSMLFNEEVHNEKAYCDGDWG